MTIDLLATVTAFLIGLIVGSFLNVVADRVPRDESVVAPPSHCDACGRSLAPLEMIPIASYLWLRGRCRTCGAPIGRRVPLTEISAAAIAVAAWKLYGPTWVGLLAAIFLWLFLVLSVMDIGGLVVAQVVSPVWLATGLTGGCPMLFSTPSPDASMGGARGWGWVTCGWRC